MGYKTEVVSVRFSREQLEYLHNYKMRLGKATGIEVSMGAVVRHLVDIIMTRSLHEAELSKKESKQQQSENDDVDSRMEKVFRDDALTPVEKAYLKDSMVEDDELDQEDASPPNQVTEKKQVSDKASKEGEGKDPREASSREVPAESVERKTLPEVPAENEERKKLPEVSDESEERKISLETPIKSKENALSPELTLLKDKKITARPVKLVNPFKDNWLIKAGSYNEFGDKNKIQLKKEVINSMKPTMKKVQR